MTCEVEGCDGQHRARGLCNRHYLRWRRAGGQTVPRAHPWTPEMDAALLACRLVPHTERYAGGGEITELARKLGKTPLACRCRLERLLGRRGLWTREGLWSEAEDDVIRHHMAEPGERVPDGTWAAVASLLGRTPGACATRACALRRTRRDS